MQLLRLDKILSNAGMASRSEAARLIKYGEVLVDGVAAKSAADKYDPEAVCITVRGEKLHYSEYHYIMMNKPEGLVSATEDAREKTVLSLITGKYTKFDLFPAGRLDKDSVGLLILTDDGDYAHRMLAPKSHVDKVYYVETDGELNEDDTTAFKEGIALKDGFSCMPAKLEIKESGERSSAFVTIKEGKYHQVKRMLASRGKPVTFLKRVSIGALQLDETLQSGQWREMTKEEANKVFLKE